MAYQDYQHLRVAVDNRICRATIDNPPMNLGDLSLVAQVGGFAQEVAADDDVNVVIVDSADPDFFMAHADVTMLQTLPTDDTSLHEELSPFHTVIEQFRTMPKATIAVIEGIARGGGSEFALAFDMRFAALGKARFAQPEVAVGIIPGGGATQRLPRLVGRARTLEIVLGGMDIDAATAQAWGYVNRALPPDELRPFVDKLAARIASYPLDVIARAKRAVDAAIGDLTPGLNIEDQLFRETLAGQAAADGMADFMARGGQTRDYELGDTPF
ncbi:MAG TPA: enoyl-CoA hydratase/isomerase family protein [Mycobacterium sp.]|jgi:enoyl-CoA hydratase/carnithine racemase